MRIHSIRTLVTACLILVMSILVGCQTTGTSAVVAPSGKFLHSYKQLAPLPDSPDTLYFSSSTDNWPLFSKVYIAPVSVPPGTTTQLSSREQKMISLYFEQSMKNAVSKNFTLSEKPGKGIITARAAITHANIQSSFSNNATTRVQIEGELLSNNNQQLVAIVDGAQSLDTGSNWDQITLSLDKWSDQLANTLVNTSQQIASQRTPKICASQPKSTKDTKSLLALAEKDFKALRLTTPTKSNALTRYCQVLANTPGNIAAFNGIDKIVSKYTFWGNKAQKRRQTQKAKRLLAKAQSIAPRNPEVVKLNNLLNKNIVAQKQRPAPVKKSNTSVTKKKSKATPVAAASPKAAKDEPTTKTAPAIVSTQPTIVKDIPKKEEPIKTSKEAVTLIPPSQTNDPWSSNPPAEEYQWDTQRLKPYILALNTNAPIEEVIAAAKMRLQKAGFDIAGEYSPYISAHIISITNNQLKSVASNSKNGGFGSAIRVGIVQNNGITKVSYNNPLYLSQIYRLNNNLRSVANDIASAIGKIKPYGAIDAISAKDLRNWHYMIGMPYFDDVIELGKSSSHRKMVAKIESALKQKKSGTQKVYRVDIPNKNQTLFGIGMNKSDGSDKLVMSTIDKGVEKHIPHLPYEILVDEGRAIALEAKFRIAQSFPDLSMGEFMAISSAPGAIESTLKTLVE